MAYEMTEGEITIFRNDKDGNDKRPDMRGKCRLGGADYKLSLWARTPKSGGAKYLTGRIEAVSGAGYAPPAAAADAPAADAGLPF
jgi:hypothetical protein